MTYPETLTQNPERHEAFLLFQPYNSDGELMNWTKLEFSYTEVEYLFKRTEMHIEADRPYEWVSDEDIEQALKDFYSDKTILTLTIS